MRKITIPITNLCFILILFISNNVNSQTNIYNSNGTLTTNRNITLNGKNLSFLSNNGGLFINGTNGNIGIGLTSPTQALDVNGNIQGNIGIFTNSLPNNSLFLSGAERNAKSMALSAGTLLDPISKERTFSFYDFPSSNFNPIPQVILNIEDRSWNARFRFAAEQGGQTQFSLFDENGSVSYKFYDSGNDEVVVHLPKTNSRMIIAGESWYLPEYKFVVRGNSKIEGNLITDSNIGIGTNSFNDSTGSYRLSVNGNIRANRVRVYTSWADYVFEEHYNLPRLEQVEEFIKENKHLPNVPSAKEVEENGIELGEITKIQQEKIEELTLYLIQQQKEINQLKEQVKFLLEKKK